MLIKKSQAGRIDNSDSCTVWEYKYPSKDFSFAKALIKTRYPDSGKVTNEECEEIYYVISGTGIIHSEKGDFEIEEGDLYYFEKGEVYWVEAENLEVILVNAPKWWPEQHKEL